MAAVCKAERCGKPSRYSQRSPDDLADNPVGGAVRRGEMMADEDIAAEVVPTNPQQAGQAAKALQQKGFRVGHVGGSISVTGPRERWESIFGVSFVSATKPVQAELGRETNYLRAEPTSVQVPADLIDLVADVAFAEPPELH